MGSDRDALRDEIKSRLLDSKWLAEVLGLLNGHGSFIRQNKGIKVLCVFHNETTPSMSIVDHDDGIGFNCFSCCEKGDVFKLIAGVRGLDVRHDFGRVLEIAGELAGVHVPALEARSARQYTPRPAPARRAPKPPPAPTPDTTDYDPFDRTVSAMTELCALERHQDVRDYIECRIGHDYLGRDLMALPATRKGLAQVRDSIIAAVGHDGWMRSGLAREDGKWLYDQHRLVIIWRAWGVDGNAVWMQRRLIRSPERRNEPKYANPLGDKSFHPFGVADFLEETGSDTPIAFVEGALDALAMRALCRRRGIERGVLAIPGVENWRPEWAEYGRGRTVFLALDADKAGDDAAPRIAAALYASGATAVKRARPIDAKDWVDLTARAS